MIRRYASVSTQNVITLHTQQEMKSIVVSDFDHIISASPRTLKNLEKYVNKALTTIKHKKAYYTCLCNSAVAMLEHQK